MGFAIAAEGATLLDFGTFAPAFDFIRPGLVRAQAFALWYAAVEEHGNAGGIDLDAFIEIAQIASIGHGLLAEFANLSELDFWALADAEGFVKLSMKLERVQYGSLDAETGAVVIDAIKRTVIAAAGEGIHNEH